MKTKLSNEFIAIIKKHVISLLFDKKVETKFQYYGFFNVDN